MQMMYDRGGLLKTRETLQRLRRGPTAEWTREELETYLRFFKRRRDGTIKTRLRHLRFMTERALERLRRRIDYLKRTDNWRGDETPILMGKGGRPLTPQAINRMLADCATMAGIRKKVTTHMLRKSVGTHIAKQNPRFAQDQLGITAKIFEAHYNQPTLDDRLERRDILPGAVTAAPRTPDEMVGQAWLKYSQGRMSREDFETVLVQADRLRAQPSVRVPETSAYG